MGLLQGHALGRERAFYAVFENTPLQFTKPAATDGMRVLSASFTRTQPKELRSDANPGNRSYDERIKRMRTIAGQMQTYLLPSGTAGTPPDVHELLYAGFGVYVNTPATSDVYTLSGSQVLRTLSLIHEFTGDAMEASYGSWVEEIKVALSQGDEPKLDFVFGGKDLIETGASVVDSANTPASDNFDVTLVENYEVGSVIQIDADDNGGAGYEVTAITGTSGVGTLTCAGESFTLSGGEVVQPFAPAITVAGQPVAGIDGSLTIDGVNYPVVAADFMLKNNVKSLPHAFEETITDIIPNRRSVSGSITIRARRDLLSQWRRRRLFQAENVVMVNGAGAGTRMTWALPTAEFNMETALEVPQEEEGTFALPLVGLGTNNELSLTLD